MATGNHKLLRVSAGVSHYADVTVDVEPVETASVLSPQFVANCGPRSARRC